MNWVIAIIALNFIILIHELGHFLVAKRSGIGVNEFSLFLGPKVYSVKKGETVFSIRSIPVGAYVALEGEEDSSQNERAFNNKPMHVRAAVIIAGPLVNLVAAVILLTVVFSIVGFDTTKVKSVVENSPAFIAGIQAGDQIVKYDQKNVFNPMDVFTFISISKGKTAEIVVKRNKDLKKVLITPQIIPGDRYILGFVSQTEYGEDSNLVKNVVEGSPAKKGGIKAGDRIIQLNDQTVTNKETITRYLSANKNKPVKVKILRNNSVIDLTITPKLEKGPEQYFVGISFKSEHGNLITNLKESLKATGSNIISVVRTFKWLITGKINIKQLMGPVGIASAISDVVGNGPSLKFIIINLLTICANISAVLGASNLIPFPALDGARLLVLSLGMIKGKELISAEKENMISVIGLCILVSLGIYTIINDLLRINW